MFRLCFGLVLGGDIARQESLGRGVDVGQDVQTGALQRRQAGPGGVEELGRCRRRSVQMEF